jgi:putative oxidoreductase
MGALLSPLGTTDLALLVLRIVLGMCVFKHGWGKLSHIEDLVTIWKVPLPLAWAVTAIQIAGAFAMVLGLLTVPFAIALAVVHLVATWKLVIMANEPFVAPSRHSWSIGLIYTTMPLVLAIAGPGAYSLDVKFFAGISP